MAPVRKQRERGGAVGVATRSRVAGSGGLCGSSEMGTSLDIKIKRANKVYHAGVSGGATPQSCAMTAGAGGQGELSLLMGLQKVCFRPLSVPQSGFRTRSPWFNPLDTPSIVTHS